jgi:protein-tyrosine-phosphatase
VFTIAFICTANMCRSVMAHAIAASVVAERQWPVEILSAGIMNFSGAPAVDQTVETCRQHGTPPPKEGSTFIRDLPLESIDRFLVMERHHFESLIIDLDVPPTRVSFLGAQDPQYRGNEIEDPINQDDAAFERCYEILRACIGRYLDTTTEIPGTPNFAR